MWRKQDPKAALCCSCLGNWKLEVLFHHYQKWELSLYLCMQLRELSEKCRPASFHAMALLSPTCLHLQSKNSSKSREGPGLNNPQWEGKVPLVAEIIPCLCPGTDGFLFVLVCFFGKLLNPVLSNSIQCKQREGCLLTRKSETLLTNNPLTFPLPETP